MNDLIEALQIFVKYYNGKYPTGCEHDVLYIYVDPSEVPKNEWEYLERLGFIADVDNQRFYSYRYGSA